MTHKLFLDANILFSAAYRKQAGLLRLWEMEHTHLYSSLYAVEEADRNLPDIEQQQQLKTLLKTIKIIQQEHTSIILPKNIELRDKDRPILQAAIYTEADYLITGDFRDFGKYFEKTICHVTILPPAAYLKKHT